MTKREIQNIINKWEDDPPKKTPNKEEFLEPFADITLQERVDAIPDKDPDGGDTILYIGSASAFFFIGTKTEYERTIDFVSKNLLANMKESQRLRKLQEKSFRGWLTFLSKINPEETSQDKLTEIAEVAAHLTTEQMKAAVRRQKTIPEADKNIAEFKSVRKRRTRTPYTRQTDGGIVITVEGVEHGGYWFYDEYKTGIPAGDGE